MSATMIRFLPVVGTSATSFTAGINRKSYLSAQSPEIGGNISNVRSTSSIWSSHAFTEDCVWWMRKACSSSDAQRAVLARIAKDAVISEASVIRRRNSRNRTRGVRMIQASINLNGSIPRIAEGRAPDGPSSRILYTASPAAGTAPLPADRRILA